MNLSELQNKDVVSMRDGTNLGRIVDAKIDDKGVIIEFVAEERKFIKRFAPNSEIKFGFNNIKKIGSDVILIDI